MDTGGGERRSLLGPAFPDDTGAVPDEVAAALAAYADRRGDPAAYAGAVAALQRSRVLVPVVAVLGEVEVDEAGLAHDKTSDMAAVLLTGADGRLALLAFTGTETLGAWDPQARPVPVPTRLAAQSAIQEGAAALVVDLAGPTTLVIEGEDLAALAAGWTLARVGERYGWIAPAEGTP
ncbi:SseB family protein [Nocardioides dongkuii]|uniref:SseB family protein n=1 Tax=Nocardioides dongkuii TaxID=2760089 RepID=UPI001878EDC3|nr:SseB family protein [Nocardioides dongkuii]